jgi:hypothetical protein
MMFHLDSLPNMNPRTFAIAIVISSWTLGAWMAGTPLAHSAWAQDPFDDVGNENTDVAARNADANVDPRDIAPDSNERDAVVRSLRSNPPRTAEELARAVQMMGRIRRWDEVGRWLNALGAMPIDPATALAILERAGSKTFYEIESNAGQFTPQQLAVVAKIRTLADQALHAPATLSQHLKQLQSESRAERLAGFQGIKAAGYSGISAVLNGVMAENGLVPNSSLMEAYSLLGPHATPAWQMAMTTPHDDARERLVQLVARAPKADMGCELLAALHDPAVSETAKQSIQQSLLDRDQAVPEASQVYRYNLRQIEKSLSLYREQMAMNDVDTLLGWELSADGRSVASVPANAAGMHLNRASQAALTTLRSIAESDMASAKAVAAHLERSARRGDRDLTTNAEFQSGLPASLRDSHEFACLIWDAAVAERLAGAQALAVANLSRWSGPLLPDAVRERLVAATKSGYPCVRYPATQALMNTVLAIRHGLESPNTESAAGEAAANETAAGETAAGEAASSTEAAPTARAIQPKSASPNSAPATMELARDGLFDGRSRLDAVGHEMQQLLSEPLILIVGGSNSLRSHMHGLADQVGFRFLEAASVQDVFQVLRSNAPIEGVFIVDHLRDMDLGQLIQRMRSNPSTSAVPIALLADSLSSGEHSVAGADHRVVMGSVPPELEGLGDILRRIESLSDRPRVDANQRIQWKESANNYMRALAPPAVDPSAGTFTGLLAATQEEQQQLLRIATDGEAGVSKREQASQIFVQSVRRFGLLITTETANAQYDVYNARGESEPVTRAVMGRILDAIEASTGQRSWSETGP